MASNQQQQVSVMVKSLEDLERNIGVKITSNHKTNLATLNAYITLEGSLFDRGANVDDLKQYVVGNCWLLAAMSSLAQKEPIFIERFIFQKATTVQEANVIQIFNHASRKWEPKTVNPKLPVRSSPNNTKDYQVLTVNTLIPGEDDWVPLLEKRVALSFGSYEKTQSNLAEIGGYILTSGRPFQIVHTSVKDNMKTDMFSILRFLQQNGAQMTASHRFEQNGTTVGHAFTIIAIIGTSASDGEVIVRNPHGSEDNYDKNFTTKPTKDNINDGKITFSFENYVKEFKRTAFNFVFSEDIASSCMTNFWKEKENSDVCFYWFYNQENLEDKVELEIDGKAIDAVKYFSGFFGKDIQLKATTRSRNIGYECIGVTGDNDMLNLLVSFTKKINGWD